MVDGRGVTSDFAADTFAHFWVGVFGAPVEIMCDRDNEFAGRFAALRSMIGTLLSPLPTSAKWRNGLAERHGAMAKLMLMRVIFELSISEIWELKYAVMIVFQAENRFGRNRASSGSPWD